MTPRAPMYRPVSIPLIRQLMQRTGDGAPVTVRQLAKAAGVPHGTIGNLLTGQQETVPGPAAHAMAHRLGVDLLVAFQPVCRSTTTLPEYADTVPEAVSA